ncbi:MAG: 50S ribosomal protein L24 [Acidobacteria bacterium]|nr:50S ribosomal protein L24 [Acidobacteriota bacterium]
MAGLKRIRKNDDVLVIAGRDRGKRGRVTLVDAERNRVVVEGINLVKKHTKPNPQRQVQGGIVEQEASIHASNVMLVDPVSGKRTRVGMRVEDDGRKVRVSRRKDGGVIDK